MYKTIKEYIEDFLIDYTSSGYEVYRNKSYKEIKDMVYTELFAYKNMHYRRFGKKPKWLSIDIIDDAAKKIVSEIKKIDKEPIDF